MLQRNTELTQHVLVLADGWRLGNVGNQYCVTCAVGDDERVHEHDHSAHDSEEDALLQKHYPSKQTLTERDEENGCEFIWVHWFMG